MQSKKKHLNQRKKVTNNFTKYKELKREQVKVKLIIGTIMHRCDITFADGNNFRLIIHKVADNLVLSQPRLWEYTNQKLAILDYLTNLVFFNDTYTILEDIELYKNAETSKHVIAGEIKTPSHWIYAISTATFQEKDFVHYDVKVNSKVAKVFRFNTTYAK